MNAGFNPSDRCGGVDMPAQAWTDFLQQHQKAHLVSAVLMPRRTARHARHLRSMLSQLIKQLGPKMAFATAIVGNQDIVEIHCGFAHKEDADLLARLMKARTVTAGTGWSSRRSFRLSADKEVNLARPVGAKEWVSDAALPSRSAWRRVVNRPTNVKTPDELILIPGAAEAIARLNGAGFTVAICRPEVARGVLTQAQLDFVHEGLRQMLADRGAKVELILCCASERKCPRMKPSAGMLQEALARYGALAAQTPFVGDQADDLKAAFHAGSQRVLVRTGLGRKTLAKSLPVYVEPVAVFDDLAGAVDAKLQGHL
jgi:D-glycero-D-manno-heptose 1,7-bisphosphate phosphatase